MTMTELERDLKLLAEPWSADHALRLRVREQLERELYRPPRRRLSVRVALGLVAATATAAAVALVAVIGTSGSGGPAIADAAIIHHALGAVSPPPNRILHVELVSVSTPGVAQRWQQTSPPYSSRAMKGVPGHFEEMADNGRTTFEYDAQTNTISAHPDSSAPTFTDPLAQVRHELAQGQADVAGRVVIDGAQLYKIDLPHGLVGYFTVHGYRPRYIDDPQRGGGIARLRIVTYQYLPMTAANRALLSVTAQHPGARVVYGASGASGR